MALFVNALHNPRDPNAPSDIELMSAVTRIIAKATEGTDDGRISQLIVILEKMTSIAALIVRKALAEDVQTAKQFPQTSFETSGQLPLTGESEPPRLVQAAAFSSTPLMNQPVVRPLAQPNATQIPFSTVAPAPLTPWTSDPNLALTMETSYPAYPSSAPNDGMTSQIPLKSPFETSDCPPKHFVSGPEESYMMDPDGLSIFPMSFQWDVAEFWTGKDDQGKPW
jgi:hypothetical protein